MKQFQDWKKSMQMFATILMSLFLMLCAGCSTTSREAYQATKVVEVYPPAALMAPCPKPYRPVKTTGDLVRRLNATESALSTCSAQVDVIRSWRSSSTPPAILDKTN
ncbi:Rz1-like lysis system protein LysC [Phyllobacterium ifriqiyense]|uniref:Rz1-like lysis system protein LysC n=1 Tax=Phyllobacterium ifriqiyense TaxID=314238 RepID=UPI0033945351